MIVAITGHRPDKIGGYAVPNPTYSFIRRALDETFLRLSPNTVIVGMALGVDQLAAELCAINGIPFFAAIPFEGFESQWPPHSQMWYRTLLRRATGTRIICEGGFAKWKMQRRNEWMVDSADRLVAVWDGSDGGTANCVRYAQGIGKPIERIEFQRTIPNTGVQRTTGVRALPPVIRPAAEALRDVAVEVRVSRPQVRRPAEPTAGDVAARVRAQRAMEEEERLNEQRALAETRRAERQRREQAEQERQERERAARRARAEARRAEQAALPPNAVIQEVKQDEPQVEQPRFGRILDLDM